MKVLYPMSREHRNRTSRHGVLWTASLTVILLLVSTNIAQAKVVTISTSGYWGFMLSAGNVQCARTELPSATPPVLRYVSAPTTWVSMADQYPHQQQRVQGIHRLDQWNGSTWVNGVQWGQWTQGWENRPSGYYGSRPAFIIKGFDFYLYAGYYRVTTFYRWFRNGYRIGDVVNQYDKSSYQIRQDGAPDAWVSNTASGVPAYCAIP